jgi:hypothetical protein
MRRQLVGVMALALAGASVSAFAVGTRHADAAFDCTGKHTWTMSTNSLTSTLSGTITDTWNRTCAFVQGSGLPFGAVTVNPDSGSTSNPWSGNCLLSMSPFGIGRIFVGPVAIGVYETTSPVVVHTTEGILGVPSTTPCNNSSTGITWSGAESFDGS